MIDASTLLLFSAAAFALAITPGPDMLLMASRAAVQGRAAGFATWAGIALGCYVHALAAAFGLAQLFATSPLAYDVLRWCGAIYLGWLAFSTLREGTAQAKRPEATPARQSIAAVIRAGFLTNLFNPKVAIFMLALLPQFIKTERGGVLLQVLVLASVLNVIGLMVNGVVIVAAAAMKQGLRPAGRFAALPRYCLATVFGALALRMVADR